MKPVDLNKQRVPHFLYPSALFTSTRAHLVTTILGSCVSVCLWDPYLKVGGINHFMLPLWNGEGLSSPKYGNIAIEKLVAKMNGYGCSTTHLVAKIFGGMGRTGQQASHFKIGKRNIALAQEMLHEFRIPVVSCSVGGEQGRKLQFLTDTGDVYMKMLPISNAVPPRRPQAGIVETLPYEKR